MLRLGFSRLGLGDEAAVDAQYPVLLAAYAEGIDTHTRLYPGAVEGGGGAAGRRLRHRDLHQQARRAGRGRCCNGWVCAACSAR